MSRTESNQTLLMVGYGSLLSGHGLLGLRRGGKSVLRPRDAFPLMLTNARRGLAKPSSHGESMASREEYSPSRFLQLLEICDRAGKPLGEFLLGIAQRVRFDLLAYRTELFEILGYSSPGYIFHPLPLDD